MVGRTGAIGDIRLERLPAVKRQIQQTVFCRKVQTPYPGKIQLIFSGFGIRQEKKIDSLPAGVS